MPIVSFRFAAAGLLMLAASPTLAHQPVAKAAKPPALPVSAHGAAATVDAFHAALRRGDTGAAASLLTDDALIFEEGGAERSKAEYSSHHLPADAAFSKAVSASVTRRTGHSTGSLAWVATEGQVSGTFQGKAISRATVETMVLRRVGKGWKIVHIHWSSGARP